MTVGTRVSVDKSFWDAKDSQIAALKSTVAELQEIVRQQAIERSVFIESLIEAYNSSLLEGEEPITVEEMREILRGKLHEPAEEPRTKVCQTRVYETKHPCEVHELGGRQCRKAAYNRVNDPEDGQVFMCDKHYSDYLFVSLLHGLGVRRIRIEGE